MTRRAGKLQEKLPDGVTVADWNLERIRWQNPRIRSLMGCTRLLGGVLESNYSILHCSPERLRDIWSKVRQVAELIRTQLGPLLTAPSVFPELEEARVRTELALKLLDDTVLTDLERFPENVSSDQLIDVRKLLCVSIGKLHAFLQDAFGEIMANDPRSTHDADYFLSRRFPQDLEEAEWLHSTVSRLQTYLERIETVRTRQLVEIAGEIRREQTIPIGDRWDQITAFLDTLVEGLTPKLKEVLALRGIRFYEMEILDRYAVEIPCQCRMLQELHRAGRKAVDKIKSTSGKDRPEREQSVRDLLHCHTMFSRRMAHLMSEIDKELRDLMAFIPIWLDSISMRRALVLKKSADNGLARMV